MTIGNVLAMVGGLLLVSIPALTVPAVLRVRGRVPFAIAALVVAAGSIVLLFTALSFVKALTELGIWVGQFLIAAAALFAWTWRGRPRPATPWLPRRSALMRAAHTYPAIAALAVVNAMAIALQFVMATTVAPNNWDSLSYHLSRAAYWLQYHKVGYFPGGTRLELPPPPVAEILDAWTLSLSHGDHFAALLQWTALLGIAAVVFSGGRLLGFRAHEALFAGLLVFAMPLMLLEATTTQNDLLVAFFVGATAFFGVRGIRDVNTGDLVIAAISLGLAVGAKGTALIAGPALGIILGAAIWHYRPNRRTLITASALATVGILAFGTYNYVLNLQHTSTLFGGFTNGLERRTSLPANSLRNMWLFVDLPAIGSTVSKPVHSVATRAFGDGLEISSGGGERFAWTPDDVVSEDETAYGPTGLFLFLPVLLIAAVSRRMPGPRRILALAVISYLALFCYLIAYNLFVARLVTPAVVLGGPLLAIYARTRVRQIVAVGLALLGLVPALLFNAHKPLIPRGGEKNIFALDRAQQQAITSPYNAVVFADVTHRIGSTGPVGYVGPPDSWDYPLFGEHLQRRVVRLNWFQVDDQTIHRLGLRAVMILYPLPRPADMPASGLAGTENFLVFPTKHATR